MKVANMEKFSDVSKTLRGYGYIFQGSNKDYSENDSTNVSTAAWSKNCSFDINTGQYRFNIGENFSIYKCFSYELFPWQIYCEYTISSESDYNLFIKTAQQNGFKYEKEAVTDNRIETLYGRIKERGKEKRLELLTFIEFANNSFSICLFSAPIVE